MTNIPEPFLTRKQAVEFVRAELGIPLVKSKFDKMAMAGLAPKPVATFGQTHLYRKADVIAFAMGLIRPVEPVEASAPASGIRIPV